MKCRNQYAAKAPRDPVKLIVVSWGFVKNISVNKSANGGASEGADPPYLEIRINYKIIYVINRYIFN